MKIKHLEEERELITGHTEKQERSDTHKQLKKSRVIKKILFRFFFDGGILTYKKLDQPALSSFTNSWS